MSCTHEKLMFASGGYYINCSRCNATWVIQDRPVPSEPISGEERVSVHLFDSNDGSVVAVGSGRVITPPRKIDK